MQQERIIVLDFGGQYKQLIARRVRECNVYCEIHPHTLSIEKIREMNPKGIIMTGGPASVYDEKSPTCSPELFEMGIPVDPCSGHLLRLPAHGLSLRRSPRCGWQSWKKGCRNGRRLCG